ncbi:MAG: hypothetical protein ACKVHU_16420 [Acidimicrobiales bacterium]
MENPTDISEEHQGRRQQNMFGDMESLDRECRGGCEIGVAKSAGHRDDPEEEHTVAEEIE